MRRPVLATVISLAILMLSLRSLFSLDVRQYPATTSSVITVSTPYPGASADGTRGFIGFVLGAGMVVGTLFTLFVVPALYTVIARDRNADAAQPGAGAVA